MAKKNKQKNQRSDPADKLFREVGQDAETLLVSHLTVKASQAAVDALQKVRNDMAHLTELEQHGSADERAKARQAYLHTLLRLSGRMEIVREALGLRKVKVLSPQSKDCIKSSITAVESAISAIEQSLADEIAQTQPQAAKARLH